MIGVCTDEFNPRGGEQQFASLLGSDRHSWGLSYHGTDTPSLRESPTTVLHGLYYHGSNTLGDSPTTV